MRFLGSDKTMRRSLAFVAAIGVMALPVVAPAAQERGGSSAKPSGARKQNELTLAGLRPGRDTLARAAKLYGKPNEKASNEASAEWSFQNAGGGYLAMSLDTDKNGMILMVRIQKAAPGDVDCCKNRTSQVAREKLGSGHGIAIGDKASRVIELYGQPDTRSPSTKGGEPLELYYYAFDWAGAEVPQVMEVLCTAGKEGEPGRVIEITLAAPSL